MASVAEATATMVKNIEAATGQKITEWITHRVRVSSKVDIDAELKGRLKQAYSAA